LGEDGRTFIFGDFVVVVDADDEVGAERAGLTDGVEVAVM
jgi:hypothetical protein